MSKNRSRLNKEYLSAIIAAGVILVMILVNVVGIGIAVWQVYQQDRNGSAEGQLDVKVIEQALEIVGQ